MEESDEDVYGEQEVEEEEGVEEVG